MEMFCSKKTPFFVYDPDNGMYYFETEQEQQDYARNAIDWYLDEHLGDDVTNVTMGKVTHQSTMTDRVNRPVDCELDEEERDINGDYWPECAEFKCGYDMLPINYLEKD